LSGSPKQKQQLEKTLRERLAKYFGEQVGRVLAKIRRAIFTKRIEAIKNRYKPTISQEDAHINHLSYANQCQKEDLRNKRD
jgi:hypothetical protein